MKRSILAILILIFIFLFSGCNKSAGNSSGSASSDNQSSLFDSSASLIESSVDSSSKSSSAKSSKSSVSTSANLSNEEILLILINKQNYIPDDFPLDLKTISKPYNNIDKQVHKLMYEDLAAMMTKSKQDGVKIKIQSAYRSKQLQQENYDYYVNEWIKKGYTEKEAIAEVNTLCAIPGQSEHNSGLAVDLNVESTSDLVEGFDKTDEYKWLSENAVNYGFILRYPKDKTDITGYQYEPWHYRYVGVENAKKIKASGLCLEEYLSN